MNKKIERSKKSHGTRTVILAMSLVLIILLAACGGSAAPEEVSVPAASVEEAVAAESNLVESSGEEAAAVEEAVMESPAENVAASEGEITFSGSIQPLLTTTCQRCHGATRADEGLLLTTYEQIMAGSDNGPVVIPGDPDNSLLVTMLVEGKMPKRGAKLSPEQVQLISDWVAAGAEDN